MRSTINRFIWLQIKHFALRTTYIYTYKMIERARDWMIYFILYKIIVCFCLLCFFLNTKKWAFATCFSRSLPQCDFFFLQNRVIISHTRVIASFADDFEINQRYGIWVFFYLVIFVFIYLFNLFNSSVVSKFWYLNLMFVVCKNKNKNNNVIAKHDCKLSVFQQFKLQHDFASKTAECVFVLQL